MIQAAAIKPYYDQDGITIYHGDCREILPTLSGVDAVVTDPPYGLSFMGKKWDYDVPTADLWRLVLAACKPGAHLLSFAGTRTQHRMAVKIEDAGFEIRDMIAWVYGSGFPKSLDVSKAIDKNNGAEREVIGDYAVSRDFRNKDYVGDASTSTRVNITAPATDAAKQWSGWGTALKPAWECVTMARKPLVGTVAENVLRHGTGAINVDGCRVEHSEECRMMAPSQANIGKPSEKHRQAGRREAVLELKPGGRWPANLIHDGSDEVVGLFPQAKGVVGAKREGGDKSIFNGGGHQQVNKQRIVGGTKDSGSAARFFYCAKASKRDRDEGNDHPTVKPTNLMRYLCRLVTPPGGVVLDPFMGSGTTLVACQLEGRKAVGIEINERYCEIAANRLAQGVLF